MVNNSSSICEKPDCLCGISLVPKTSELIECSASAGDENSGIASANTDDIATFLFKSGKDENMRMNWELEDISVLFQIQSRRNSDN